MGYHTNFSGKFCLDRQLRFDDYRWLLQWSEDRHEESEGYPSYYCDWTSTDDGMAIEWDGGEKFYGYIEWIEWLIANFFQPRGYILNGAVEWDGEERGDVGKIIVQANEVQVKTGKIVYEDT